MSDPRLVYIPPLPRHHGLPSTRGQRINTVARCPHCSKLFVARVSSDAAWPVWKPLRWWHRSARRGLANQMRSGLPDDPGDYIWGEAPPK